MLPPLLFSLAVLASPQDEPPLRLWVSQAGDDSWSGRIRDHADGTAGPFRTLPRAFAEVRQYRRGHAGELDRSVEIVLTEGTHFLDAPLVLEPEDSCGDGRSIVVAGEHPPRPDENGVRAPADWKGASTLSGGRRIEGWTATEVNGRAAFFADVPQARNGAWPFRELFVNGERRTRARHPDHGFLTVAGLLPAEAGLEWNKGVTGFRIAPGELDKLRGASGADVTVMCRWVDSHCRIASIDFEKNEVRLRDPTVFKLDPGDAFFVDGALALLDAPGEWCLDEQAGRLYYLPLPGEDVTKAEVIAPRLDALLRIRGDPANGAFVDHVAFVGLRFAHCGWWFASAAADVARSSGFPQAAVGVPAALDIVGARHVSIASCALEHLGGYAVSFGRGCDHCSLDDCDLGDLGAGGVKIGETAIEADLRARAGSNHVERCSIHDGGRVFPSAIGVWIGQSEGNQVDGNEIANFYYTGISIGWTWGYGESLASNNHVLENVVHHIGQLANGDGPILSDMGAIYTLGTQHGTRIERNWFHDVAARNYGGWGIYFDEGSTGIVAEHNFVARTTHGGFHQHYGKDNVVRHNVFAYGRDAQIQRTRCEPHTSFRFEHNVVLWKSGALFAGDLSDLHFVFDSNLYWREGGGAIDFAGRSLEKWKQAGMDARSLIAEPAFVNAVADDFTVIRGSPIPGLRIGVSSFVPARDRVPNATPPPWQSDD